MSPFFRFYRNFLSILVLLSLLAVGTRVFAQENDTPVEMDEPGLASVFEAPESGGFCSAPNQPIPPGDPNGVSDTISIFPFGGTLANLDIQVDISHTWVGDLNVYLENELTGTTVQLVSTPGGELCSGDDMHVFLDDEASLNVQNECQNDPSPAYTDGASYQPFEGLSAFSGEDILGNWTLTVEDIYAPLDDGTFEQWCLIPTYEPSSLTIVKDAEPADGTDFLFTSDLPAVKFLDQWGNTGTGEEQFMEPRGLDVDIAGNVYIADSDNQRIQKFDNEGNFVMAWGWGVDTGAAAFEICTSNCQAGISGSGDGQFSSPRDVLIDEFWNVYVVDTGNNRIQKFNSSGNYVSQWGSFGNGDGQFNQPTGIAVSDGVEFFYVVDSGNNRVQKFNSFFVYQSQWGSFGGLDGEFNTPKQIGVDSSGNVYVTDHLNYRVQKFDSNGGFLLKWGFDDPADPEGAFDRPVGIEVDAYNNVYISDWGNHRIQKFTNDGYFLSMWGWGVQNGAASFQICIIGCQAGLSGNGDGQLNYPQGIAIDENRNIFVVEQINHRAQKFGSVFYLDDATPDDGDSISDAQVFSDLPPDTYHLTEILPNGWTATDITCDFQYWSSDPANGTLSVSIGNSDNVTCTFTNSGPTSAGLIYVDDTATGANNGTSWADAYTDLQDALAVATSGTEIRVAAGLYLPGTVEMDTFHLKNGVAIYGLFPNGGGEPEERDFANYTVLSGDLAGDDLAHSSGIVTDTANIVGDNAYHVVTANGVDNTAVLDGFYITAGQADNSTWPDDSGGGMFASSSNPFLQNIRFIGNYAVAGGGGVRLDSGSSPTLRWVYFDNNHADVSGGGMLNADSNPLLINTAFTFNSAETGGGMTNLDSNPQVINGIFDGNAAVYGGGMENNGSNPVLVNVTFVENHASDVGGALRNRNDSLVDVLNSIFWNNSPEQSYQEDTSISNFADSLIQDGCPLGSVCIGTVLTNDPLFVRDPGPGSDGMWGTPDDDIGDLHLTVDSPAINAGNNIYLPADVTDLDGDTNTTEAIPFDFDFNPRITNGTVDMGAYEWNPPLFSIFLPTVVR